MLFDVSSTVCCGCSEEPVVGQKKVGDRELLRLSHMFSVDFLWSSVKSKMDELVKGLKLLFSQSLLMTFFVVLEKKGPSTPHPPAPKRKKRGCSRVSRRPGKVD